MRNRRNNEQQLGRVPTDENAPFGASLKPGLITGLSTKVQSTHLHSCWKNLVEPCEWSVSDSISERHFRKVSIAWGLECRWWAVQHREWQALLWALMDACTALERASGASWGWVRGELLPMFQKGSLAVKESQP